MLIKTGRIEKSKIQEYKHHYLVHGGVGPADPKKEDLQKTRDAIQKIIDADIEFEKLHHCLPKEISPDKLSIAELLALKKVEAFEENPLFNAGIGGSIQEDGKVRVSAAYMESQRQNFSAVVNAQELIHPSQLTQFLQFHKFPVLDGDGSKLLADRLELKKSNLVTPQRLKKWEELKAKSSDTSSITGSTSTVGCVSVDTKGNLAAITSTGGIGNETVGRIGDTPSVTGNFCSKNIAISCTGIGEEIRNMAFAVSLANLYENLSNLEEAAAQMIQKADDFNRVIAAIVIAKNPKSNDVEWAVISTRDSLNWGASVGDQLITH